MATPGAALILRLLLVFCNRVVFHELVRPLVKFFTVEGDALHTDDDFADVRPDYLVEYAF